MKLSFDDCNISDIQVRRNDEHGIPDCQYACPTKGQQGKIALARLLRSGRTLRSEPRLGVHQGEVVAQVTTSSSWQRAIIVLSGAVLFCLVIAVLYWAQ